jgi:hypothetical protein
MSKEFLILIAIAFAMAAPVAYHFMHDWLQNFKESIPLGASAFIIAIGISIAIAWITISYRATKAAMANPIKSLRSE